MRSAPAEKWVEGTSADDRARDVAASALRGRLAAVLYWLDRAARHAAEDVEYVHQLRVWSRRATAAFRLFRELLPRRRTSWMRKQLKRVRSAANDARDCDVLAGRLAKHPDRGARRWLEAVRVDRAKAQNAVVAVYKRLGRDERFARRIDKLLQRIRAKDDDAAPARFGDWARDRLGPLVERFFAAAPAGGAGEEALHQFRIRGKELRYALEILRGAFPSEEHLRLYEAVESIQDRLGEINDLATAKAHLQEKIKAAHHRAAARWRRLLAEEQTQLDRADRAFGEWCSPAMLRRLRKGFEVLLTGRSADADDPPPALRTRVPTVRPPTEQKREAQRKGVASPAASEAPLAERSGAARPRPARRLNSANLGYGRPCWSTCWSWPTTRPRS